MAKMAEQVTVDCNPSPLVVKGGKIDADLTVNYPAKYFNKKAIMEVTPVIVYGDKERKQGYRSPMQNVAPQGQVVIINDCGHMVNMERPEEFNRVLMDFLRGL